MNYGSLTKTLSVVGPTAVACDALTGQCCISWIDWLNFGLLAIIAILLLLILRQMYRQYKGEKEINK